MVKNGRGAEKLVVRVSMFSRSSQGGGLKAPLSWSVQPAHRTCAVIYLTEGPGRTLGKALHETRSKEAGSTQSFVGTRFGADVHHIANFRQWLLLDVCPSLCTSKLHRGNTRCARGTLEADGRVPIHSTLVDTIVFNGTKPPAPRKSHGTAFLSRIHDFSRRIRW